MDRPAFELSEAEYAHVLRHDLSSFTARVFAEVSPASSYLHNWHIDLIASRLEDCRLGKIKRLVINIPPRNLKSICASVAFPAWLLAHDPQSQIICASYGQELANKHARDTRAVMEASWYRAVFPTRLSPKKNAVEEFATTRGGLRLATSVGGVLTGRGADVIIIDDPLKPDEAVSDANRQSVNQWYDTTLYSRLNDKAKGCIILIMQRLHLDDLVGHVLEQEGWAQVILPVLAAEDEVHRFGSFLGQHEVRRTEGALLHPAREPLAVITQLRHSLGEYAFAGQYNQAPIPAGGSMVKEAWFKTYAEPPSSFDTICQSWDTASKAGERHDYSVCTTWGLYKNCYYLLDVTRARLEFPELRRAVISRQHLFKAKVVLIEERASGIQLIQDLRLHMTAQIIGISPENDKQSRLMAQSPRIEAGRVYLPTEAHWKSDFIRETTTFPFAKHDDQVDSLSQFLAWAWLRECRGEPRIRQL